MSELTEYEKHKVESFEKTLQEIERNTKTVATIVKIYAVVYAIIMMFSFLSGMMMY